MASETTAKTTFKEARKLYEAGFKSANKKDEDNPVHVSWWKRITGKSAQRNEMQTIAAPVLSTIRRDNRRGGNLDKGKYLYDSQVPAANCGDLAQLSCYLAHRNGVPANQL